MRMGFTVRNLHLETDARIMVDQQLYSEAFQLANAILSTLDSVDMDDSAGGADHSIREI